MNEFGMHFKNITPLIGACVLWVLLQLEGSLYTIQEIQLGRCNKCLSSESPCYLQVIQELLLVFLLCFLLELCAFIQVCHSADQLFQTLFSYIWLHASNSFIQLCLFTVILQVSVSQAARAAGPTTVRFVCQKTFDLWHFCGKGRVGSI